MIYSTSILTLFEMFVFMLVIDVLHVIFAFLDQTGY